MAQTVQVLGLRFLDGDAGEAVTLISGSGGVLVVPAAPALVCLQHDPIYRNAITRADAATRTADTSQSNVRIGRHAVGAEPPKNGAVDLAFHFDPIVRRELTLGNSKSDKHPGSKSCQTESLSLS